VEAFPKEVQTDCSICLHTLKVPYVVGCCGYRFCKSCLVPSVKSCPLCKEVNFDKLPDKQLERLLNQRPVYCLLQDNGCRWTGELSNGSYYKRADLQCHRDVCESRPSLCVYCTYKCPYKELASHYKNCPMIPQKCKNNCSEKLFIKKELKSHLAKDCPLEAVTCEYQFAGCNLTLTRKDMKDHEDSQTKHHLSLVTTKCTQLQKKETSMSVEIQQLQTEMAKLTERLSGFVSRHQEIADENRLLKMKLNEVKPTHIKVSNLPTVAVENDIKNVFRRFGMPNAIIRSRPDCAYIHYTNSKIYGNIMQSGATKGIKLMRHRLVLELSYYP